MKVIWCTWYFLGKRLKQKKTKLTVKQEMAERRLREKIRQQELLENDKDDTSSTTTDSSSEQAEDKVRTFATPLFIL